MGIPERYQTLCKQLATYTQTPVLVAVTKTRSLDDIRVLYQQGQRRFGENRIEELETKARQLTSDCPDIEWHFIGTYQSNKLNALLALEVPLVIHSLATPQHVAKLLRKLEQTEHANSISFYLQVNTAREEEKSGFDAEGPELFACVQEIAAWNKAYPSRATFLGLMTMARLRTQDKSESARACFSELAELARKGKDKYPQFQWDTSMGMTQDYLIALDQGAKVVRIGSLLFENEMAP